MGASEPPRDQLLGTRPIMWREYHSNRRMGRDIIATEGRNPNADTNIEEGRLHLEFSFEPRFTRLPRGPRV